MIEFGNEKSEILFFGVDIVIDRELDNCNFPFDIKKEIAKEKFSKYLRKLFTSLKLTEENYFITALPRKKDELDLSEKDEDDFVDYITQKISDQEPKLLIGIGELARELLNLEEYGVLEKTKKGHKIAIWHPLIVQLDKGDTYDEWYEQIEPSIPLIKEFIKEKTDEVKKLSKCQEFVHLHIHDEYSLLDGYGTVEEYAQAAKERGWRHLAITNHGMLGQIPRQYNICKELEINAIYGCEVYLNDYRDLREYNVKAAKDLPLPEGFDSLEELQGKFRKNYHLTLLAKNNTGLSNLIKLTSDAWINGFYRRPRTTHEQLEKYSEGLLCGTACYAGPISQSILDGDINRAYKAAEYYKGVFGKDFFLELMLLDIEEQQRVNTELVRIAQDLDIDLVVTSDCHYVKKDDSYYQDIMLLIQNNNKIKDLQDDPDKIFTFHSKELWYKTAEDLDRTYEDLYTEIVPRDVYEQAKRNSVKFADRCNVEIDTSLKIADYDDIGGYESSYEYLEHLAFEGLKQRGKDTKEYVERLKMELDVIKRKNYSGYFLIVWDMVKWSWDNDIWVGCGRGSAAGALLCYVLKITDVDPLQFNLFFERFLNEARQDMPDIDIDFEPYGRDAIKDYIIQRYGRNKTCAIGTYGTYQTRASIGDVCRVFDVPLVTSRIITKQLTSDVDLMDKEEAEKTYGQLFEPLKDHRYKQIVHRKTEQKELNPYDTFWNIRGRIRNISAHAAGFIISKHDLTGNLPLVTRQSNVLSAWIEGKRGAELSSFGFVKYDILGLLNLTFIKDALKIIKARHDINIDVHDDIDSNLNDPKIYEQIMLGNGNLIFQFESPMMRKLLRDSKCDSFDCLAAITALGRPGPLQSGMTDEFCKRKLGKSKYKIHPLLEEVLGYTYGIVVYQEQIMQIANKIADFTLVETDILRKLLTKVKGSVKTVQWKKLQEYKKKFIGNGKKHLPVKELEKLFDGFLKWAGYGFNKSHAVSYTVISYRCAWLRTYYPKEYICAVLKNIPKDESKYESYIREAKKLGIEIINVDINKSNLNFTIDGNSILIGFINLKGTGVDPAAEIAMKRPFTSLEDFIERTIKQKGKTKVSKRVMMPLILVGAFDEFGDRIDILFRYYKKCQNRKNFLVGEHGRLAKERDKNPVSDIICTIIEKITNNLTIDIKNLDIDDMNLEEYKLSDEDNDKFTNTVLGFELINKMNLLKIDVKKYGTIEDIKDNGYGASIGVIKRIEDGETKAGRKFYKVGIEDDNSFVNLKIWDSVRDRFKDEVKLGRIVYFAVSRYSVYSFRPCTLNSFIHITRDIEEVDSIIDKNNIEYTRKRAKEWDKVKSEDRYLKTLIKCEEMNIGHPKLCFGMINNIELSGKLVYATLYDEGYSIDLKAWLNVAEDIGLINADVHDGDFVKVKVRRDNDFAGMKTFFIENILKLKAEPA